MKYRAEYKLTSMQEHRDKSPGEPLFTLDELATKAKASVANIRNLLRSHPLEPTRVTQSSSAGRHQLYTLSSFKAWWRALPEDARERAKKGKP